MKKTILSLSVAALGLVAGAVPASAQPAEPPPPPPAASASMGGGSIGVGATELVSGGGPAGPLAQFVYDLPVFHLEGLLGFLSTDTGPAGRRTTFTFGVGGWYHLHRGAASDFSIGGDIAVANASGAGAGSATVTVLEPGAQARVFITPNVALHGRVGLGFEFGDGSGDTRISLAGQVVGGFGFTYFFR